MTDVSLNRALRGLVLLATCVLFWFVQGCSADPMTRARRTIAVSAEAVVAIDRIIAPRYAAAVGAEAADPEVVRRWNRSVEALLLTRSAVLVAEATLDAIDAGEAHDIGAVMGCVVVAIERLIAALPTVGVDLPESLVMALSLLGSVAGTCEPEEHPDIDLAGVPSAAEVLGGAQ